MMTMRDRRLVCGLVLTLSTLMSIAGPADSAQHDGDAVLDRASGLVSQLTLDEKLSQLLNVAPAIPRPGIPAYNWWTESLHGAIGTLNTTNFPEPIGLAASFDTDLVHSVAGT